MQNWVFVLQSADFQRVLRRERDSNPRRCDPQRFSRPPQSTTLPSLLIFSPYRFSLWVYPYRFSLQILLTDFLCGIPFAGLRIARRLSIGLQSYELFFGLANFPRFSLLRSDTNALITSSIRWLAVVHEAATGNQEAATGNQVLATGQRGVRRRRGRRCGGAGRSLRDGSLRIGSRIWILRRDLSPFSVADAARG